MKFYHKFYLIFFSILICFSVSKADIVDVTEKFNDLILNNDNLEYPYLEKRNDIGIFYDFSYDEVLNKIKIKRNQENYPIVRFSLFNKKDIKPGNIIIKYNEVNLSKLNEKNLKK